jgi:hypothetical protein
MASGASSVGKPHTQTHDDRATTFFLSRRASYYFHQLSSAKRDSDGDYPALTSHNDLPTTIPGSDDHSIRLRRRRKSVTSPAQPPGPDELPKTIHQAPKAG